MESLLEFVSGLPPTEYKGRNLKYGDKFNHHMRRLDKFNGIEKYFSDDFRILEITI